MSNEKSKDTRTRNWNLIIYPDSAPANWRQIIDDWRIEWIESPLHDKDLDANLVPKKPHWHVLIMFSGVKSYDQVRELTDQLFCPMPQKCHNAKASTRYMVHMDDANKYRYDTADIIPHGGVDIAEMLRPSSSEEYSILGDIMDFVTADSIVEFSDLADHCRHDQKDWLPIFIKNQNFLANYVKSKRHKKRSKVTDPSTGEISYL